MDDEDRPVGAYDVAAFGRVTVLVAPDRQRAWALCQPGWDDDGCGDWAAATHYLDRYGLGDVQVDPRTDWHFHPDGSDTFVLRGTARPGTPNPRTHLFGYE